MVDQNKIREGVRLILEGIGEDVNREGLKDTPDRMARMYEEIMSGERNVLFKMKELWNYMIPEFEGAEKMGKKIKKVSGLQEYRQLVDLLFQQYELKESL